MYEVELKVRGDHDRVRERLRDRDADSLGSVRHEDTYYDAPHREFADTDEALRIRREYRDGEESARLTYKGPLLDAASKTREEHETGVNDGETAAEILEALGFESAATVRKHRERWQVDQFTVALDDVDGLGTFVEIETESESADFESARESAADVLASLGLDAEAQIRTSYLGLLLSEEDA